jgi:hypothetical protein
MHVMTSTVFPIEQGFKPSLPRPGLAGCRIDISGASGATSAGRSAPRRSIDYARMSDSDILNL